MQVSYIGGRHPHIWLITCCFQDDFQEAGSEEAEQLELALLYGNMVAQAAAYPAMPWCPPSENNKFEGCQEVSCLPQGLTLQHETWLF